MSAVVYAAFTYHRIRFYVEGDFLCCVCCMKYCVFSAKKFSLICAKPLNFFRLIAKVWRKSLYDKD